MTLIRSDAINTPSRPIAGVVIPDSKLAREVTELVRDTEPPLLFHHSSRVYYWGALTGKRRGLHFDPELLYAGAMFHDMGLTPAYASSDKRFEVDSANTARDFLRRHASTRKTSRQSGRQSHCTRHPASRSTCIPSSRS
jgi:HD superfamily phosphodiesterase